MRRLTVRGGRWCSATVKSAATFDVADLVMVLLADDDLDIDAIGLLADEHYRTLHGAPSELLFRACRGRPRLASKLLHAALIVAQSRDQAFLDDSVVATAIADLSHELLTNPDTLKPRTQTETKSRR